MEVGPGPAARASGRTTLSVSGKSGKKDGIDYFCHATALSDSGLIHELRKGDTLELQELENAEKGWRANRVIPVAES